MIGKILNSLKKTNVESISGMDAAFLYLETPTSPMHIGSVAVIDGELNFEALRSRIASRIHLLPKLRKRLVYVPMSIDHPYWVDDPNFDLDMHLQHVALPKPGGWAELRKMAARIFSEPLNQNHPLWSFTFIEGLDNIPQVPKGSVAIISKIHHVAIDGMAGASILGLLFDFSPTPPPDPEPETFKPKPLPNELSMIWKSAMTFTSDPLKFPRLLTQTLVGTFKAGMLSSVQRAELPTAPFTAPQTPLNGLISTHRTWNSAILSLDRLKILKNKMGTSLNDVILAICSGALRRYLEEKGKLPLKSLVAHVPISIRGAEDDDSAQGNQISGMLVQLATDFEDPLDRLEHIHENTVREKTYQGALGAKTLSNMAEMVPFGLANQAAQLYSRFHLAELHNPVFNVTITNVPGPQFPLYLSGHKLLSIMGMAPIIDGMGLIITVFSYDGNITFSSTSNVKSMPDIDTFSRYIRWSADELEKAILKKKERKEKKKKEKVDVALTNDLFKKIKQYLKENAEKTAEMEGLFNFEIQGEEEILWKIDLNKNPGIVRRGRAAKPDVVFKMKEEHLHRVAKGELDLPTSFVQGRLQIEGDMEKALQLGQVLSEL